MSTFSSLLRFRKGKAPGDAQKKARSEFPGQVAQSRLTLRDPAEPIPPTGKHFIIGIATYSADELNLLDQLDKVLENRESETLDVKVFDVLDCQQMSDFERFIPGIGGVYLTPVLGVIVNGKLIDRASGLREVMGTLHRFHVMHDS